MSQSTTVPRRGASAGRKTALWSLWAVVVSIGMAYGVWALHILVDVPSRIGSWWLIGVAAFPVAAVAIWLPATRGHAGAILRASVSGVGLAVMVLSTYLIVVVGLGQDVEGSEHRVLGLSMVAGAVSVLLAGPVRSRLRETTLRVAGRRESRGASALEHFGARMTRAVPMDELLLQLAEVLHETIGTGGAEVWTGEIGVLERTTSVPDRGRGRIELAEAELAAVAGARVSGRSWAAMWLPAIASAYTDGDDSHLRVAPVTHLGKVLGLIVVARAEDDGPFRDDDDRLLSDLARQIGLALHNVRLDSALQESLEALRTKNAELQASRVRIVTAADDSRRRIERDLHDGAQQRLVALAVKVQMAKLKAGDPDVIGPLLDDLGQQVQETVTELRELAHGIYPPLLRDRGLADALSSAGAKAALPTRVEARTERRFDPAIEAAVYFCCLEAMQNASKYAGDEAKISIIVEEESGLLTFTVADDGVGFDVSALQESQGFMNMRDRVGAHGGEITVESSPGEGTVIRGQIPARAVSGPD